MIQGILFLSIIILSIQRPYRQEISPHPVRWKHCSPFFAKPQAMKSKRLSQSLNAFLISERWHHAVQLSCGYLEKGRIWPPVPEMRHFKLVLTTA